jgi:glycosyltransferase involved in cell wall biosynthesis
MSFISGLLFEDQRGRVREWWTLKKLKRAKDSRAPALARFCEEIAAYQGDDPEDAHARVEAIYSSLSRLTDEFFVMVMTSLEKDLQNGHADRVLKNISAAVPAAFMIAPFFTSMHHLYSRNRDILRAIDGSLGVEKRAPSRLLWFSDTVTDLNGVAVTMRELAATAALTGRPVKVVTSLPQDEATGALPPNTVNLPCIYSVTPEFYSAYTLRLPSILSALDIIAGESPDEIVISTPGPVGLLGLAAARVLGVPCTGVYHTDFTKQADHFIGDEWVSSVVEAYTRWFFQQMDHVRVPSQQYITMMSDRGLDPGRMSIFRRGIEPTFAEPDSARQASLCERFGLPRAEATLMWAGRLGKEKNLDFLMGVCKEVMSQRPGTSLLMVGDGPELERLKREVADDERIVFTGRVNRADLAQLYLMSDVFVFPSTTDTFGMVILEGHACGLPAIVTDVGGPQEIVSNGETGFVVKANDKPAWVAATIGMLDLKHQDPEMFAAMRQKAR